MRKLEVIAREIFWSLKKAFKPTTYDHVLYKGSKCYIKSPLIGDNIWDLYCIESKQCLFNHVTGSDFKLINSPKKCLHRFKNAYNFQKRNWRSIDYSNPIGTRLSYISSDNIFFYRTYEDN